MENFDSDPESVFINDEVEVSLVTELNENVNSMADANANNNMNICSRCSGPKSENKVFLPCRHAKFCEHCVDDIMESDKLCPDLDCGREIVDVISIRL